MGSLTAALRFSKAWVRKDAKLGLRSGCIHITIIIIIDIISIIMVIVKRLYCDR